MSIGVDVFAAETVKRWRRGTTTTDTHGDQRRGPWSSTVLAAVSIVPGTATEDTLQGFAQLDNTATLYGPDGLDLQASDEVEWRGQRWTVQGTPARWSDPLGIGIDTTVIELRHREG